MDSLIPLMLLLVAGTGGEPLAQAMQRRSDSRVYADAHQRGYSPVAYAALSLHAPFPVLHVLSRVPLQHLHDQQAANNVLRPAYAQSYSYATQPQPYAPQPYASQPQPYATQPRPYAPPAQSYSYRSPPYAYAAPPPAHVQYVYDSSADGDEPNILYARPNPRGGYTYRRRRPTKPRAPPKPPVKTQNNNPLIIRVHKYRVVRDR